ncbi:MAG: acyloxyacyl hydrolase [Pseudomonadota bacterium]
MSFKKISVATFITIGSCLSSLHTSVWAVDSTSLEAGTGNRSTFIRAGLQWDWKSKWFQSNGTHLGGYWDLTAAQIRQNRYQGIPDNGRNLFDLGLTPVFRFQRDDQLGWYAEGGIGVHYFSSLYDNNDRQFSTRFQFGDHIGLGYVFNNRWDIGAKIQHFSNGSIKQPNDGANFAIIKAAYRF